MNNIDSNINLELAVKHITGNATEEESILIQKWIDESDENKDMYNGLKEAWMSAGNAADLPEIDTDEEWNDFRRRNFTISSKRVWLRVAAMIAIILSTAAILWFATYNAEKTLVADSRNITMKFDDGSETSIRKESSIIYPENFEKNERRVKLSGEGWFHVSQDKTRPFIVETKEYFVEVLGTSFFVKETGLPGEIIVSVESGKVAVQKKEKNDRIVLNAGETGICTMESSEIKPSDNNILNNYSWRTNRMVFDNTSVSGIAISLKEVYGIDVEFSDKSLGDCKITTTFNTDKPEAILDIITQTFGWTYRKEGTRYIITGTSCG